MAGYGDFSFFYDALMENADYRARFDYIKGLLADNSVSKGILLDMACGTGTLSALFAKSGFDVIGVDASENMLSLAQEKKLSENFDALFLCQKMEELDLFGTVDAAVCTLDRADPQPLGRCPCRIRECAPFSPWGRGSGRRLLSGGKEVASPCR